MSKPVEHKVVIKSVDMADEMQTDCIDVITSAVEKFSVEKDMAASIKREFDKKYQPTWHCIVGKRFGSYVTHETRHFIYMYIDEYAVLLFKSG
ncbi:Dynein light chain 1, cytoplasmic [Tieghemiomyces parasiticus]|uniref:Dynein light chain n=1 Tax=Tieghemiomyces parasiticus TaxID=78921 RepID=A0A9W8DZS8_9FUNG|nr:Dynein light chain 1, cytoplasmic [Tieghemiomyces parasiticus]